MMLHLYQTIPYSYPTGCSERTAPYPRSDLGRLSRSHGENYSYASVSFTVSREALLAGNALAMVARINVPTSQTMIPFRSYTGGRGAVRIPVPTPKQRMPVIGKDRRIAKTQLIKPTTMPSMITMLCASPVGGNKSGGARSARYP